MCYIIHIFYISCIYYNLFIIQVIALYPYVAQNADELSFEKDDIIAVTNRDQDPAWWQGEYHLLWCLG